MINDVSASLWPVAARHGVGWVAMHRKGTPATMQQDPHYDDVVAEVAALLADRAARAGEAGVREVWIDPGIGFGKTVDHNLALLGSLGDLVATGYPVMVGTSRKSFLASVARARRGLPGAGRASGSRVRCLRRPGPWPRAPDGPGPRCRRHRRGRGAGRAGGLRGRGRRGTRGRGKPSSDAISRRWECERQVGGGDPSRNFTWVIKDRLAMSERPGGFAPNHRKVRRQEEIIWLQVQGFTRVISLLPSSHNLQAYEERSMASVHFPLPSSGDTAECWAMSTASCTGA